MFLWEKIETYYIWETFRKAVFADIRQHLQIFHSIADIREPITRIVFWRNLNGGDTSD